MNNSPDGAAEACPAGVFEPGKKVFFTYHPRKILRGPCAERRKRLRAELSEHVNEAVRENNSLKPTLSLQP